MTLTNIIANISSLYDRDKEYLLDYLALHFSQSSSQQGALIVKKGLYHLNNINNYHSRLKKWISRFSGVSTKYLQLYLVWFQFLDNRKKENDLSKKKQMLILASVHGTWATADKLRLRDYAF